MLAAFGMTGAAVAGGSRIADEGELGTYYTVAKGAQLDTAGYPETMLDEQANACLSVGYRVSAQGVPGNIIVLDRWNSVSGDKEPVDGFWKAFEASAVLAVSQWRFQPLEGVEAQPTFTVSTFGFMADDAMSNAAVRSHCRVAGRELAKVGNRMSHDAAWQRASQVLWSPPHSVPSSTVSQR
ncbi:MAG: hypothetical protein R3F22_03315 [Lysobacteraceae bacterium]